MNTAPVIIFTYDRLDTLKKTIRSLENNDLARETDCFIFSDYYDEKKNNYDKVCNVRAFLNEFSKNSVFANVFTCFAPEHKGLSQSIIQGVTKVISRYGKAIIVEDDLVVSKSFLRYMNEALIFFQDNPQIWSISGYSIGLISTQNINSDIYLSRRGSSWGWATWYDRWESVDWDVKDYEYFIGNEEKTKSFNLCGEDMTDLLRMWRNKQTDSWAIRFDYAQYCKGKYTVFPKESQVINLGMNGEGSNCNKSLLNIFRTYLYELDESISFELVSDYRKIEKEKARVYSSKIHSRLMIVYARWYTRLLNRMKQRT